MANQPSPIQNAGSVPLNEAAQGSIPFMGSALLDWFQPMVFEPLFKTVDGFQVLESTTPYLFHGVIQPLTNRALNQKPEGQRAWTWFMLHCEPSLKLNVDEVVSYLGIQTRVMARKNYTQYGYLYYELVQDFLGSGPIIQAVIEYDGGEASTVDYPLELDGGDAARTGDTDIDGGTALAS